MLKDRDRSATKLLVIHDITRKLTAVIGSTKDKNKSKKVYHHGYPHCQKSHRDQRGSGRLHKRMQRKRCALRKKKTSEEEMNIFMKRVCWLEALALPQPKIIESQDQRV